MKKIIILDFASGEVLVYPYDENVWDDAEDMKDKDGDLIINSSCQWMIVDELQIKIM